MIRSRMELTNAAGQPVMTLSAVNFVLVRPR